jgi:alpha-glucosidase
MPWSADAPNLGFSSGPPWLPLGDTHRALAADLQNGDVGSLLNFTRQCLALRNTHSALHHGSIKLIEAGSQRLVFDRVNGSETLRCAFNLSGDPAPFQPSGRRLLATGDIEGDTLGPYAAVVEEIA